MRSGLLFLTILGAIGFHYFGSERPQEVVSKSPKARPSTSRAQPVSVAKDQQSSSEPLAEAQPLRLPPLRNSEEVAGNSRIYEPFDENEVPLKDSVAPLGQAKGKLLGRVGKSTDEEVPFDEAFVDDETLVDEFKGGTAPAGQRFGNAALDSEIPTEEAREIRARADSSWDDPDQDPPEGLEVETD